MNSDPTRVARRSFLAGLAALAATVVAARATQGHDPRAAVPSQQHRPSTGYRLTDHVRAYYRTARM